MLSGKRLDLLRLFALTLFFGAAGCVERRMVISEPPGSYGAIVYDEKNQPIGAAPVDKPFTYYGKYSFRLAKDGYETLDVIQDVRAPWYEFPGLDFISENLIPWTIRDVRRFYYTMQPAQVRTPEQVLREAQLLRTYGANIGEPGQVANPPAPGTVLMPPTPP
jgi:hypothetical protein